MDKKKLSAIQRDLPKDVVLIAVSKTHTKKRLMKLMRVDVGYLVRIKFRKLRKNMILTTIGI